MMHRSYHRYFIALGFCLATVLAQANLIKNPEFGNNVEKWKIQKQEDTELTHTVTEDGPDGKPVLEFDVTAGKNSNRLAIFQSIPLKGGQTYKYTFKIKADRKRKIVVKFREGTNPWPTIGKEKSFEISDDWQTIEFSETVPEDSSVLIHISNLGTPGKIWFSDPVLVGDGEAGTAVADADTEAEEKPKKKPAKKDEDETTAAASPKVELPKGIGEEGRISATDPLMKTVTVHSPKTKEDEVYQITDNTKIYVNGHDSTLANIEKGMIVVVVPDADPIMAAAIHAKAAGSKSSSAEPKKEAKAPEKDKDEDKPKAKKQPAKKKKK
jgi:hypothetical protein